MTHNSVINDKFTASNNQKIIKKENILILLLNVKTSVDLLLNVDRHRPGHSFGKNIKLHEMKNEKNYVGFLITKI